MGDLIQGEKILCEYLEGSLEDEMEYSSVENCLILDFDNVIDVSMQNNITTDDLLDSEFPYLLTEDDIKIAIENEPLSYLL